MFAPLQSEAGKNILEKFNLPKEDFDTFVLVEGDRCFLRSSAGLRVLQGLGFPWNLFYIFIIIPSPIRDIVYRFIARNRYNVFGKRETCMVPSQELSHRFLQ
jgi:predicted DCC family thiol-disulfide oxidoreductase YuxK